MNETLDITQALPHGTHVVNQSWLKQHNISIPFAGGVYESQTAWVKVTSTGTIAQAGAKDITVIAYLVSAGFIDQCHLECALSFMELLHAYRSKSACKANSIYLANKFSEGASIANEEVDEAHGYIASELGGKGVRLIEYACTQPCDLKSGCHMASTSNVYRKAMEILLEASDEIWRVIQAKREEKKTLA